MSTCACHPGNSDNGWHEIRCEACRAAEMDVWRRVMEISRSPEFLARFKTKRADAH